MGNTTSNESTRGEYDDYIRQQQDLITAATTDK